MKQHKYDKLLGSVAWMLALVFVSAAALTACQKEPAVWQEQESIDDEAISSDVFDEETHPSESTGAGETDTFVVEDTTPEMPEMRVKTPVFSQAGGVYSNDLAVTLTCSEPYTIHYTTDGSVPTASSHLYTGSISVLDTAKRGTSVRAACFDEEGNIVGDVVTHTYIRRQSDDPMHVVSITVDRNDLKYLTDHYLASYEKPAHVEIVTPDGQTVISQDAGLRIFGGSSRSLPQKSFKIIARKDGYFGADVPYNGGGSFKHELFPDRVVKSGRDAGKVLDKYDSFILRNGGNDSIHHASVNPENPTLLRDGLANLWANEMLPDMDTSLSQFTHVYINGEYYGILDMRENLNEDYVKRVYGVEDEDVVVIKSELHTELKCEEHDSAGSCRYCNVWFQYETDEDAAAQKELQDWINLCRQVIEHMEADDEAYVRMYRTLSEKVDLDAFMQYMALNMYVCNTDWPHNNVKLWRYTGEKQEGIAITDGKWRFMTRDMDMAFGRYTSPYITSELDNRATMDTFYWVLGQYLDGYSEYYNYEGEERLYPDSLYLQGLLAFCMRNAQFRADFVACCRTLAGPDATTCLRTLYTQQYKSLSGGMREHLERWHRKDKRIQDWSTACSSVRGFISERADYFNLYLDRMLEMYP